MLGWKEWRTVNYVWEVMSFRHQWGTQEETSNKKSRQESEAEIGGRGLRLTDSCGVGKSRFPVAS